MNDMDNVAGLDKELAELKGFIAELKADRAAQKEKERREAWTKYTSLSLVFIAVLAAVATQRGGGYSSTVLVQLNKSTLYQAQASDQWSFYQAKSIKQNLYEGLQELAPRVAEVAARDDSSGAGAFKARIAKYEAEKAKIMADAKQLEQQQKDAQAAASTAAQHGGGMGKAISLYQIAIALGSICLVTKKKSLWYLSLFVAALGTAKLLQVWLS